MTGKKKLLITGGLGNLGSWLTTYFSSTYEVYVLSKNISTQLEANYKVIQADITDLEELKEKISIDFDYCIHTASYNEFFHDNYSKKALLINTLGTRNLVEILKDTNIKNFIYLSTFHIYGVSHGYITENSEVLPTNDYASTHLFAEYYIRQFFNTHNFPFTIFRLTNSYGAPINKQNTKWYLVLNDLVRSAYINNEIVLKSNGKTVRDFIWMGDVCKVIKNSLDFTASKDNIYNLSSNTTTTILNIAKMVQTQYQERYKKKIDIFINEKDTTIPSLLQVDNSRLMKKYSFSINNEFENEINKIFDLLERE